MAQGVARMHLTAALTTSSRMRPGSDPGEQQDRRDDCSSLDDQHEGLGVHPGDGSSAQPRSGNDSRTQPAPMTANVLSAGTARAG